MKRRFRIVSAYDGQRSKSYSTYDKAVEALKKMAYDNGDVCEFSLLDIDRPEDFDWFTGYHPVKAWYNFVACDPYTHNFVITKKDWPCYTIVEFREV